MESHRDLLDKIHLMKNYSIPVLKHINITIVKKREIRYTKLPFSICLFFNEKLHMVINPNYMT